MATKKWRAVGDGWICRRNHFVVDAEMDLHLGRPCPHCATDRRRVLWVVEVQIGKRWMPLCGQVAYTRRVALTGAANHKHYFPETECRVRAYVPREEKSR